MNQKQIHFIFPVNMSQITRRACMNCSMVLVFLLLLQVAGAQYNLSGIDQVAEANNKALGGKAVVLVYKDGKPVYKKETSADFKAETQAPIGYSSKWLTAALVMTFVDKGELSLDDPVSKYIPVFTMYSKSYITIRHCLAEVTGIESEQKKLLRIVQKKKFASLEEEVNNYAAHKDIVANPGNEFYFGDVGFAIAGRVLEIVSKRKTFSKLMQERITKPLGMKKTNFTVESGAENPADGAVSTATDYAKFMVMLLNNGIYEGKQILSAAAVKEMEKVQFGTLPVKSAPKSAQGLQYGLGEWIQESEGGGIDTVMTCPGIYGTWPFFNRCRGYACIIFTPQQDDEQKPNAYQQVKEVIEEVLQRGCK